MNTPCPACDRVGEFVETQGSCIQIYHGRTLVVHDVRRMRCACGQEILTDEQADELLRKTKELYLQRKHF